MSRMCHTQTNRGKRVVVTLHDGTVLVDRFIERAKSNRWIKLEKAGRVMKRDVASFANLKGPVNEKRLGKNRTN